MADGFLIGSRPKHTRLTMARLLRAETRTARRGKPHTFFQIKEVHTMKNVVYMYCSKDGAVAAMRVTCPQSAMVLIIDPQGFDYPRYVGVEEP